MIGPNLAEVTATCTPNMIGGSLPGWVLEPPVDLMNIQCRRYLRTYRVKLSSIRFVSELIHATFILVSYLSIPSIPEKLRLSLI